MRRTLTIIAAAALAALIPTSAAATAAPGGAIANGAPDPAYSTTVRSDDEDGFPWGLLGLLGLIGLLPRLRGRPDGTAGGTTDR